MNLRRNLSSLGILLVILTATVAFTGCHGHGFKKTATAQVGTHAIKVDRHVFHFSNTDYKKGDTFYKYAEKGPFDDFEFTLTDERVAINGKFQGLVKPNDELRVDDDGVVVKSAGTDKWMDHGQTAAYLAQNAKESLAKN
jgi:hypothetical protein